MKNCEPRRTSRGSTWRRAAGFEPAKPASSDCYKAALSRFMSIKRIVLGAKQKARVERLTSRERTGFGPIELKDSFPFSPRRNACLCAPEENCQPELDITLAMENNSYGILLMREHQAPL